LNELPSRSSGWIISGDVGTREVLGALLNTTKNSAMDEVVGEWKEGGRGEREGEGGSGEGDKEGDKEEKKKKKKKKEEEDLLFSGRYETKTQRKARENEREMESKGETPLKKEPRRNNNK